MIELRPLKTEDIEAIRNWPAYTDGFEQMDYALRENGWIDDFLKRAGTWIYIAEADGQAIGFSILSITSEGEAEFRIALHPHWTGRSLGRELALATLSKGFRQLGLERIHLIVRKTNTKAERLYNSLGFACVGESVHHIQGNDISFSDMSITRSKFIDTVTEGDE